MTDMVNRPLPSLPGEKVEVSTMDFLLPTGILVQMQVGSNSTLRELKENLFREARKYPLFSLLKEQGFYNFLGEYIIQFHVIVMKSPRKSCIILCVRYA